ncbi:MAG: DUF5689 domain-containing protein [Pseudoflavonifractor sp.]|nr:DUF5689 domain-containing protein [Pseudoflavonifractor sp.]
MRQYTKYIGMLLLSAGMASCSNHFDRPPLALPEMPPVNSTINEVKTLYWQDDTNYATEIGTKTNAEGEEEHIVIAGRVISSDQSNNIYKSLVIQDESGALAMSINATSMFEDYPLGQKIIIDLTGMTIGKYSGLQQLGEAEVTEKYGTQTTFMDPTFFREHMQFSSYPDTDAIDVIAMDMDQLPANGDTPGVIRWQSQLVRFDNVHFEGAGSLTFADGTNNTNRTLVSASGKTLTVRNSGYANFADKKLPSGTGSVVGILSYFNTGWQLLLRSYEDCIGFEETGDDNPTRPIEEANTTILEVKTALWQDATNYATEVGTKEDGSHYIVKGRVVSSDESGNIYKYVVIEDATAALTFSVNDSKIYQTYPLGQEVTVDLTGLYIGKYAGWQQAGLMESSDQYGTQIGRMGLSELQAHTKTEGTADPSAIQPKALTISQLTQTAEAQIEWQGRFVELSGVHFQNGGSETFSDASSTSNRTLLDASGNSIIVRTSNYASFKGETLPSGTGKVRAIVSYFNGTWQLLLNSANDCIDFDGTTPTVPDTPVTPDTPDTPDDTSVYTVAQVIAGTATGNGTVEGYIVGWVDGPALESGAKFTVPATSNTNLLLAGSDNETDVSKCIPVQLPSGTVRAALNLVDNPGNLGKKVRLTGSFETYFKVKGLKSVKEYAFE